MQIKRYKAKPYGNGRYRLGESPFMDERTGILSFVDIIAGKVYLIDSDQKLSEFDMGQMVGALVPWKEPGTYVAAMTDGLYLFDGKERTRFCDLTGWYAPWQRSNDAKCDPAGRLYFGSTTYLDEKGVGGDLYCFDEQKVRIVRSNTGIANGMAWSRDQNVFYFSDSYEAAVFAYHYDIHTGDIDKPKVLFTVEEGVPDGMTIDDQDNLFVAIWDGGRIEKRSGVTGELLAVIEVPARHCSSCCFMDRDTLFITSSGEGLKGEHDGALFTCTVP